MKINTSTFAGGLVRAPFCGRDFHLSRPAFQTVSVADGLNWRGGGEWVYQEKKDGVWAAKEWRGSVLVGEQMRDGCFWAFDIINAQGDDCRNSPLRDRLAALSELSKHFEPSMRLIPSGQGGEFLEAVLAAGGEGIVAKHLDSRFGKDWVRCKRQETHDCRIVEIHPRKQSVRLSLNGQECGWCPVLSVNALARIAVGSVIEVVCHSIHLSGKLREPRMVRLRPDKA